MKREKDSKEDDIMFVTWNSIFVVCAYLVPPSSPYVNRNEKKIEEIQETLFARSRCMLLIDANAWIGDIPSEVAGAENGSEQETKIFKRCTEKIEINKTGQEFVTHMNNINMIIHNGVKTIAQYTYDHPGKEAKSIKDYIATSVDIYDRVSFITYVDRRKDLETDHILLQVDVDKAEGASNSTPPGHTHYGTISRAQYRHTHNEKRKKEESKRKKIAKETKNSNANTRSKRSPVESVRRSV